MFAECSKAVLLLWIFLLFMFHVCLYYAALSVPYNLMITCWERADLLAPVCDVFLCFCHFPMWCLGSGLVLHCIIPDLCFLPYFHEMLGFPGPPITTTRISHVVRTAPLKLHMFIPVKPLSIKLSFASVSFDLIRVPREIKKHNSIVFP